MRRTKTLQKDKNHYIVRDYINEVLDNNYNGVPVTLKDTSALGGLFLDWIIVIGLFSVFVEVKTEDAYKLKNHRLKKGEDEFIKGTTAPVWIVANYEHLNNLFNIYGPFAMAIWDMPLGIDYQQTGDLFKSVDIFLASGQKHRLEIK